MKPERRSFIAGFVCGGALVAIICGGSIWWKASPERSANDAAIYDSCLASKQGNTVACDAMMRMLDRERTQTAALIKEGARMLAAGVSKRDVVNWAIKQGAVGSQISDAAGITLRELQSDKY
ncbi:hypothetical protein AB8Z38_11595 [Bradyrhizobium sp. LLZ17]|uniref:Uncharacterized protein n=1 Tax=Bradyrhizobium sp. LLZ17 TaxID=3239388 RepID=A0AB39XPQ4_9BRAD